MPKVVLRNPKVKLPYVLDIPDHGLVSRDYAESGWEIDAKTTPEEAALEAAQLEVKPSKFVAKFAPKVADESAASVTTTKE
jgi:hypothetical protein